MSAQYILNAINAKPTQQSKNAVYVAYAGPVNVTASGTGTGNWSITIAYSQSDANGNPTGVQTMTVNQTTSSASHPFTSTGYTWVAWVVATTGSASTASLSIDTATVNSTGVGSALLGSNFPGTVPAAPYTWIKQTANDGTVVYVPAWK
jgi:hypothetical protein